MSNAADESRPPTVLVVEDELIVAMALEDRLRDLGWQVVGTVATGEAAVEVAASEKPDLVLMDVRLAGPMGGAEAALRIVTELGIRSIFMTAYSDPANAARCAEAKPLGYIAKPHDDRVLVAELESALRHVRSAGNDRC